MSCPTVMSLTDLYVHTILFTQFFVPVEDKETKDAHLSLDVHMRTRSKP